MKLRLREDPREWQKFAAGLGIFPALALIWLWWRKGLPQPVLTAGLIILAAMLLAALASPRWFRGPYRVALTFSFRLGQVVGRVLLTLLFLTVLTPLGLLLRLMGKDLLALKPPGPTASYWRRARPCSPFDRLF